MANSSFVVKNGLVVGSVAANTSAVAVGANVVVNSSALLIGNTSVSTTVTGSLVQVQTATATANLAPTGLVVGSSVVNSSAVSVAGQNAVTGAIALTGHVAGSGNNSIATTIQPGVITSAMLSGPVDVAHGGTGASDVATARSSLGVPSTTGSGASGTWPISISGTAATSSTVQTGAGPGTFSYIAQSTQPSYLWGTNDGVNVYVWNPLVIKTNAATYSSFMYNGPSWMSFSWADPGGNPTFVWGSNTSSGAALAMPARFNVNAATYATYVYNGGGWTTLYWGDNGGNPTYVWGSNTSGSMAPTGVARLNVNSASYAGYATSAGSASSASSASSLSSWPGYNAVGSYTLQSDGSSSAATYAKGSNYVLSGMSGTWQCTGSAVTLIGYTGDGGIPIYFAVYLFVRVA